jgi:hypothetical protein
VHGATVFHRYSDGPTRSRFRCKRCVGEAVLRRQRRIKRILVQEAGGGCRVCGYNRCMTSLHFHHVNPSQKAFSITMAMGRSIDTYREEARKCVLVCANCHGEIEAGLTPCPPLLET